MNYIQFSVVIPLYNKANYITRTLKTVLKQTYLDFEVLVVDDGSTDNGAEKVMCFSDPRIKLFQKENGGVSSARNYGIKMAQNEFVAFLDADDEWENDYLETIACLIRKYPSCGMYATAQTVRNKRGEVFINYNKDLNDLDFIIEDICSNINLLQTSAICVKKEVVVSVNGFAIGVNRGEDLDCWLKIACRDQICYYNKPKTIYYHVSENNLNSSYRSYKESFPYWKWRNYDYSNAKSLNVLVNRMLIALIRRAISNSKIYDAFFLCTKFRL